MRPRTLLLGIAAIVLTFAGATALYLASTSGQLELCGVAAHADPLVEVASPMREDLMDAFPAIRTALSEAARAEAGYAPVATCKENGAIEDALEKGGYEPTPRGGFAVSYNGTAYRLELSRGVS